MTVNIENTFKIKSKRKEHPNVRKYPGRPSLEMGTALRKFMSELSPTELEEFRLGTLVFEEEASAEFFDSILVGDVVGVGLLNGINEMGMNSYCEPSAYLLKILEIDREKDTMKARNVTWEDTKNRPDYVGEERELAFEDLSAALGMGFGEILERDGKPYGVSEEVELTVNIVDMSGSQPKEPGLLPPTADTNAQQEEENTKTEGI